VLKQESKRDAVRRAAAQVFLEKGYAQATIQEIATLLGMTKQGAYYHMGSKEELLCEILLTGVIGLVERLSTIVGYPLPALDRLRLALRDNLRSSVEELHAPITLRYGGELEYLTAEHRAEYMTWRDKYQQLFIGLIEEGIAAGEIRPLPHPKIVAFGIMHMAGTLLRWYRTDGPLGINEVADIYWDLTVSGLKP
jgi:TetR/AcrR family transcriptional regulator, cholesterol catabolism regulator